jgi:TonB family protein
MRVCRGILALLCSSVALADAPLVRAQDASSANLPEHFDSVEASATPRAKKKKAKEIQEASSGISDENLPPVPALTPAAEVPATSGVLPKRKKHESTPVVERAVSSQNASAPNEHLPPAEQAEPSVPREKKKARVKRRVSSVVHPEQSSVPAPTSLSLSVAQSMAESAPLPEYPYQAVRANIIGSGICVMIVDPTSGKVTNAMMAQSTGNAILDKVTTDTFRRWRFKPGTVSEVRVPISYE